MSLHKLLRAGLAVASLVFFLSLQAEDTELLGPLTRDVILAGCPDWRDVVAAYQPDLSALERLKTLEAPVEVKVFLGTWCPDSKAHVSAFFKVLDVIDNPLLSASYIGLPRDKARRADYYGGRDILKLPTFLVLIDGLEKGRIVETPAASIEQDLLDILSR